MSNINDSRAQQGSGASRPPGVVTPLPGSGSSQEIAVREVSVYELLGRKEAQLQSLAAELTRLRMENKRLQQELDSLKKPAANA